VRADEALAIGLVNRVVPKADLIDEVLRFAATLAAGPRLAQAAAKAAIDEGLETTLEDGLAIEAAQFVAVSRTEDAERGIRSFVEHGPGKATFVGR
jgi:enoyl-CoA hydratase/carnithine racemase